MSLETQTESPPPIGGPNDLDAPEVMKLLPVVKTPKIFHGVKKSYRFKYSSLHHIVTAIDMPGDFAEFGVFKGACAKFFLPFVTGPRKFHLFDSFEGLPETWYGKFGKGHFDLGGRVPRFRNKRFVVHKGWFKDTVPPFAAESTEPLAFLHMDADLYSSTMDVLVPLNPRIGVGTVLLFDEYIHKATDEEHRALMDWSRQFNRKFQYIWRTEYCQVAVRVTQ